MEKHITILKSILVNNPQYYANKEINEAFYAACTAMEVVEKVKQAMINNELPEYQQDEVLDILDDAYEDWR